MLQNSPKSGLAEQLLILLGGRGIIALTKPFSFRNLKAGFEIPSGLEKDLTC